MDLKLSGSMNVVSDFIWRYAMKGELCAKAEIALMGMVVMLNESDVPDVLDYIGSVLGFTDLSGKEIVASATQYLDHNKTHICGISCTTIYGEPCVNIILKDRDENFDIADDNGVLCYVHNFVAPYCSELGYCYFKKKGGSYHRTA